MGALGTELHNGPMEMLIIPWLAVSQPFGRLTQEIPSTVAGNLTLRPPISRPF